MKPRGPIFNKFNWLKKYKVEKETIEEITNSRQYFNILK